MRVRTSNITSAFFCLPKIALERLSMLSGGDLKVYLNLCSRQDNATHRCYPSLTRIAEDTETSEKTASRSVNKLEELGLIEIIRHADGNEYRIVYEVEGSPISSTLHIEKGGQNCLPGVDNLVYPGVDENVHLTILNLTTLSEQDSLSSSSLTADEPKESAETKVLSAEKPSAEKGKKKSYKFEPRDVDAAANILAKIIEVKPNFKSPSNFDAWANDIRLMRTQDKRTYEAIWKVFCWANADSFWKANILSPATLREKFDRLELQMQQRGPNVIASNKQNFKPSNVVQNIRNLSQPQ